MLTAYSVLSLMQGLWEWECSGCFVQGCLQGKVQPRSGSGALCLYASAGELDRDAKWQSWTC